MWKNELTNRIRKDAEQAGYKKVNTILLANVATICILTIILSYAIPDYPDITTVIEGPQTEVKTKSTKTKKETV